MRRAEKKHKKSPTDSSSLLRRFLMACKLKQLEQQTENRITRGEQGESVARKEE